MQSAIRISYVAVGLLVVATSASAADGNRKRFPKFEPTRAKARNSQLEKATFGGGCFWCVEAVYENLKGVKSVVAGYSGGRSPNPTYAQVLSGLTGHAEVAQITYDPSVISYPELLEIFWSTHDPTTLNRQGPDVGTQYRSVIFYHDAEQQQLAEHYKRELDKSGAFRKSIVTEVSPLKQFYEAENYHQDYFANNSRKPYCRRFIRPKIRKLRLVFKDKLKTSDRSDETKKRRSR